MLAFFFLWLNSVFLLIRANSAFFLMGITWEQLIYQSGEWRCKDCVVCSVHNTHPFLPTWTVSFQILVFSLEHVAVTQFKIIQPCH